jgi:hypothetical protein
MTLTEKEKQHITEEEEYRAKIRDEKRGKGCSGCLIAIVIIVALFAIILMQINPAKQFEEAGRKADEAVIGKHAYNKITGAYRGEILEVKQCNTTPQLLCYVVNQPSYMRPMEAPIDNSVVKDEAPSLSE